MKKKLLIALLCVIFITGLMPISSFANNAANIDPQEEILKQQAVSSGVETRADVMEGKPDISREEVNTIYRQMDADAADILHKYENSENDENDYYALTISTKKEDRIAAMYRMAELYNAVTTGEQEVLYSYMSSYSPYAGDQQLINRIDDLNAGPQISFFSSYSRDAAATWALNNYNYYNSNYPDLSGWGGDCANFVSQAMHVGGGMPMQSTWYCYKKNTTYPAPTSSAQLDYSWTLANPSPWISAKEFKNFWSDSSRSTTYTYDKATYLSSGSPAFSDPIYTGHAISFCYSNLWWYEAGHTAIVVGYKNSDYVYAQHQPRKPNGEVKTGISGYDAVVFYAFK